MSCMICSPAVKPADKEKVKVHIENINSCRMFPRSCALIKVSVFILAVIFIYSLSVKENCRRFNARISFITDHKSQVTDTLTRNTVQSGLIL